MVRARGFANCARADSETAREGAVERRCADGNKVRAADRRRWRRRREEGGHQLVPVV